MSVGQSSNAAVSRNIEILKSNWDQVTKQTYYIKKNRKTEPNRATKFTISHNSGQILFAKCAFVDKGKVNLARQEASYR